MKSKFLILACGLMAFQGCSNQANDPQSYHEDSGVIESDNDYALIDDISGTYVYSEDNFEARITISGSNWSGVTILYGESQYDNGVVSGNSILDDSGLVEIGYVNGSTLITTIGSTRVTLRKR